MLKRAGKFRFEVVLLALFLTIFLLSVSTLVLVERIDLETALYWTTMSMLNTPGLVDFPGFYRRTSVHILTAINGVGYLLIVSFLIANFVEVIARIDMKHHRIKRKIESIGNHLVVCGYGHVGGKVCEVLEANRVHFVVVDKDRRVLEELKEREVPHVEGDAMSPKTLEAARIRKARGLVVALDSDANNILAILTARELNPNLFVAARAFSEDSVDKLREVGAEIIVLPEVLGGSELGKELLR
ncbi:MAG: NAD(P)-binding protein [Candidatus Micrarchaeota archaeon]